MVSKVFAPVGVFYQQASHSLLVENTNNGEGFCVGYFRVICFEIGVGTIPCDLVTPIGKKML